MKMWIQSRYTVLSALLVVGTAQAQVANVQITNNGVSPASNTFRSFNDSSLTRDRDLQNALDLLEDFYPSIEVSYSRHDNVRRRNDSEENDTKLTIAPSLEYRNDIGRHSLYLAASALLNRHNTFDQEDSEAINLRGMLSLDVSNRFDLNVYAGVNNTYEERGVSGSRTLGSVGQLNNINELDEGPDEVDIKTIGADLVYGKGISRFNLVLGFEKNDIDFENNFQGSTVGPFANRNRESDSIHLDVSYEIGARLKAFGRIENTDIDYDRSSANLDSELDAYLIGLRYAASSKLNGVVSVGKQNKDFELASREDYDGSSYYVNLNYNLRPYSIISLNASKLVEEAGDDNSDYFVSSLFGVSWSHALSEQLSLGVYYKAINDEFNNAREDDFDDFGLNVDYIWRRWLTVGLNYGKIKRDSNRSGIPYDEKYIGITLKSDLRRF
ncbi:MAG: outer membrane beta-barrel protein [Arenicella sp.]